MNKKYRIMLGIFVGIFTIISIISTIPGVGFIRALLILIAGIVLLGIIVGGMYAFGPKIFWWDYFKPSAAVPIAWGLFHLGFAIVFPNFFEEIWVTHFKLLLGVELAVFVLNSIVNVNTEFNKRFSRKAMTATYVVFFIFSIGLIFLRITDGETAAKQDREWYTKMQYSKAAMTAEKIRQNSAQHAIDTKKKRLDELMAKTKDGALSSAESLEAQTLPKEIKKLASAVPGVKDVVKDNDNDGKGNGGQKKLLLPPQRLSGIHTFRLPANGNSVKRTEKNNELPYQTGVFVHFEQKGSPGKFKLINKSGGKYDSWTTSLSRGVTGPADEPGIIELASADGKPHTIKMWLSHNRT